MDYVQIQSHAKMCEFLRQRINHKYNLAGRCVSNAKDANIIDFLHQSIQEDEKEIARLERKLKSLIKQ